MISQTFFASAMQAKHFNGYNGIITVKTVSLCRKLFFIKNLKREKKMLALTSFYYLSEEI